MASNDFKMLCFDNSVLDEYFMGNSKRNSSSSR